MTDYADYVKGGEILIAPSLDYKNIYIVKCSECDEQFALLESFISHSFSHYGLGPKVETSSPAELEDEIYEDNTIGDKTNDFNVSNDYEVSTTADEYALDAEEVDPLTSLKQERSDESKIVVKEETTANEGLHDSSCSDDLPDSEEEMSGSHSSANSDNNESDDESVDGQDNQTRIYIRNFMKSRQNVTALIKSYKNIPHMWNLNYPTQLRRKDERVKSLQQIAAELVSTTNLQITYEQVSAIIVHLRYKYRERIKFEKSDVKSKTSKKNRLLPPWIFQKLSFLKPFVEYNPIAILDSYNQDLMPEQIIQILAIYERFPHLWDTNLMENYCFNKRSEALKRMADLIELKMGLEVDETALKKYLHCVHVHFSREKQRCEPGNKANEDKSQYYEHMEFLYDHVGLFKCTKCKRKFKGPIHLKEHQASHDGTMPLNCSLCKHDFKTAAAYVSHVRRHMGDLGEECQECGKKFLKAVDLRIHMRSHTGDKPFCCELCGTSYRQQQAFLAHKRKHEQKFVVFCPVCSKGFYTKNKMKVHVATHYDVRNYVCGICGKAFKTRNTLQKHEYTHEEGRNHECTLCGKMFKNKINLAHHKRTHGRNITDLIVK